MFVGFDVRRFSAGGVLVLLVLLAFVVGACGGASGGGDGTRYAVVPGGPHPYFKPMKGAVQDAQKDFDLAQSVYRVPESWDLDKQNETIRALAANGYNAFAIFPGDVNGTNTTLKELDSNGASLISVGACVSQPTEASFCLATDVGNSAYIGTKKLIDEMGGKGKIVHVTGFLADPNTKLRREAVEKAVDETGGKVELVQTLTDIDSPEAADKAINNMLAARGDKIDGIVATAYAPAVAAAKALGQSNQEIAMVGIDDDPIVLDAIRSGEISGTMVQNPYGQAYVSGYVLDSMQSKGCEKKKGAPFSIDSGTLYVNSDNIDAYKQELEDITKKLQDEFKNKYLSCEA